ncbi:MAG: insulinase family protein [Myxococcales bacterium]|nr:insulinase family protein [Myxococcales bacterium]
MSVPYRILGCGLTCVVGLALMPSVAAAARKPVPVPVVAVVPPPPDPLAVAPVIGAASPFVAPVPVVTTLSNGVGVWVISKPTLPLVSVVLHVPGGAALDPMGHEGAAWLSDRLMTQGAGTLDAAAFAETVERLGIELEVRTDQDGSWLTASMKKDQLGAALGLIGDMVLKPRWSTGDYKRERGLAIGALTQGQQDPPTAAEQAASRFWWGPKHRWGHPAEGSVKGMGAVTVKDVQGYHAKVWTAAGATITVAGDITSGEAQAALESRLGAPWAAKAVADKREAPQPRAVGTGQTPDAPFRTVLIDSPDAAQTMFFLVFPGLPEGDAALPALRAGTIALGGSFTSRLNALLREKKGYTYGARARVEALPGRGVVIVSSRIRTDVTGLAMTDLLGELKSIQQGITPAELKKAQGAFRQDQVEAMESVYGVATTFANYQASGFGPGQLAADLTAMDALTVDAVKAQMGAYDVRGALVVLVGDKAKIQEELHKAGISTIEVVEAE